MILSLFDYPFGKRVASVAPEQIIEKIDIVSISLRPSCAKNLKMLLWRFSMEGLMPSRFSTYLWEKCATSLEVAAFCGKIF